jgi:hypothetical protein
LNIIGLFLYFVPAANLATQNGIWGDYGQAQYCCDLFDEI